MPNGQDQYDIRSQRRRQRSSNRSGAYLPRSERESAEELLGRSQDIYGRALEGAEDTYEGLFGDEQTQLSDQEMAEHLRLAGRFQELTRDRRKPQPIRRAPSSEFSLDIGGLHQGIIDLVDGIQDSRRRDELFGDPEQQTKLLGEIGQIRSQAETLREQAEQTREGDLTEEAMRRMDDDTLFDPDVLADSMEAEANRLEEDAQALQQTLDKYMGVSGRYQRSARKLEKADEQDDFKQEFITTFGQQAAQQVTSHMQRMDIERERTQRQENYQEEITRRSIAREKELTRRAIIKMGEEAEKIEATEVTPSMYHPKPVQSATSMLIDDIDDDIQDFRKGLPSSNQTFDQAIRNADPEVRQRYQTLLQKKRYLQDIQIESERWEEMSLDSEDLPPSRPPRDYEIDIIDDMYDAGVPEDVVEAWKFYKRIDMSAPPAPIAPPTRQPGQYSIPSTLQRPTQENQEE